MKREARRRWALTTTQRLVVILVGTVALLTLIDVARTAQRVADPPLGFLATEGDGVLTLSGAQRLSSGEALLAFLPPQIDGATITALDGDPVGAAPGDIQRARLVLPSARQVVIRRVDGTTQTLSYPVLRAIIARDYLPYFLTAGLLYWGVAALIYLLAPGGRAANILLFFGCGAGVGVSLAAFSGANPVLDALKRLGIWCAAYGLFQFALAFPFDRLLHQVVRRVAGGWTLLLGCLAVGEVLLPRVTPGTSLLVWDVVSTISFVGHGLVAVIILSVAAARSWSRTATAELRALRRPLTLILASLVLALGSYVEPTALPYRITAALTRHLPGGEFSPRLAALLVVGPALLPGGLGLAILSRNFLGIDSLLRRSLLQLGIWLGLAIGYALAGRAVWTTFDLASHLGGDWLTVGIAVACVAGTFGPLQRWLTAWVGTRLFGDVYDLRATVSHLTAALIGQTTAIAVADTLLRGCGEVLQLRWGQVALAEGPTIAWGALPSGAALPGRRWAVRHGETDFGTLVLGPKTADLEFNAADETLVAALVPMAAAALQSATLIDRLRRLYAALAEAREQDRRALARDLHDDPIQHLARLARDLARAAESGQAEAGEWQQRTEGVVLSLRALSRWLRPTDLDRLGLVGALAGLTIPDVVVAVVNDLG